MKIVKISEIKVSRIEYKGPAYSKLLALIKIHGINNLVIIDKDMNLVNGYFRLEAMRELGYKEIEVEIMVSDVIESDTGICPKCEIVEQDLWVVEIWLSNVKMWGLLGACSASKYNMEVAAKKCSYKARVVKYRRLNCE